MHEPAVVHARVGATLGAFWLPNATCLHQRPCGHPWLASQPSVLGESQPRDSSNGSRRVAKKTTKPSTTTVHAAAPPDITATPLPSHHYLQNRGTRDVKTHLVELMGSTTKNRG
ncbi:hypothetical protein V6N13_008179 [Hibiscus sabdariffa]